MQPSSTRIVVPLLSLFASSPFVCAESLNGVPVEVLARRVVTLANGSITYLLIKPPALASQPAPPPTPVTPPSEAEIAAQVLRDAKTYVDLGLRATVYAGSPTVTEVSWTLADGRIFRAFSSVDFTYLSQFTELEVETTIYGLGLLVSDDDPAELPAGVREALSAAPGAQYLFEGSEADAQANEVRLQALDHLHAYYQLNEAALVAATASRLAEAVEQARQAAEAAAKPRHEKIYFWKVQ